MFKGKKMPGRMGGERVTVQNCQVRCWGQGSQVVCRWAAGQQAGCACRLRPRLNAALPCLPTPVLLLAH